MKTCTHCGREFSDYEYYKCCPRCLKFVDKKQRTNKIVWKIISVMSGLGLATSVVWYIYEATKHGVSDSILYLCLFIFAPLLIFSKIKKDERRKTYLYSKIIEHLIQNDVDVSKTFGSTYELEKIINKGITKND